MFKNPGAGGVMEPERVWRRSGAGWEIHVWRPIRRELSGED